MRDQRQFPPNPQTAPPGHLRALAASARLANVPSVASNVCVGAMAALMTGADASMTGRHLLLLIPAGICLYLAGNFLNDWSDREWDARHRPERALPRGLFKPGLYLTTAIAFSLLGLGLAAAASLKCLPVAAAIMVFILIYTAIHKRSAWSVIPMGLCRALLPALGFFGCTEHASVAGLGWSLTAGFALLCYIAGLSLSARGDTRWRWMPTALFVATGLAAAGGALEASGKIPELTVALTAFSVWMVFSSRRFRKTASSHVSSLLAGIPLVDWIFIFPAGIITASHGLIWLPPLAFLAGLALQRLAPAT